jgi:NDP-sugar pyrophosphorylase family protein
MKAVIPLAGKGTRLRPHTLTTPKPLVHVAGRPVMSYILDDLIELGVTEIVFVIGYLGEVVKDYVAREYPTSRRTMSCRRCRTAPPAPSSSPSPGPTAGNS